MGQVRTGPGGTHLRDLARFAERPGHRAVGHGGRRRRLSRPPLWMLGAISTAMLIAAGGAWLALDEPSVTVSGLSDGDVVRRDKARALQVAVDSDGAKDVHVLVDGEPLEVTEEEGGRLIADASGLSEGEHTLAVQADGRLPWQGVDFELGFTVNLAGPTISVPAKLGIHSADEPLVLKGMVRDAASLTVNGAPVPITGGKFEVPVLPAPGFAVVRALDGQGNPDEVTVEITDQAVPARHPGFRAVHATSRGWSDPAVKAAILDYAERGLIDSVQLDIKDESGEVGYDSQVPLAREIGAVKAYYDARTAIDELHGMGLRVIGRIVNFRDPVLGPWAAKNGKLDYLVMNGDGSAPYDSEYGDASFTNPAHPDVRQYNIDLAVEAAELGFDDILYDYVRRPDGPIEAMSFPGIDVAPDVAVAEFVQATDEALEETSADLGVSVFGIAATRPEQIAQDVSLMLPSVDFVSPMLYPSLWNPGEYDVARPSAQPYEIVMRSLADFNEVAAGSGVAIMPWLQDFSLRGGVQYGPAEVDAQIKAAYEQGAPGFLVWNANSVYHGDGLVPSAPPASG